MMTIVKERSVLVVSAEMSAIIAKKFHLIE
jgi:hypothetical protein